MTIARLNLSYGDHEASVVDTQFHQSAIANVRQVASCAEGKYIGVALDIQDADIATDPGQLQRLHDRNKANIGFALEQGADMVLATVRQGDDVDDLRHYIQARSASMRIISKIGNMDGVRNLAEIMEWSDGVIVDRSALADDKEVERIFLVQKKIAAQCNIAGKPVICAGQTLESMTASSSCKARTMSLNHFLSESPSAHKSRSASARHVAKYRPEVPIIAVTKQSVIARQLLLYRGIYPFVDPQAEGNDAATGDPVETHRMELELETSRQPQWQNDVDRRIQFGILQGSRFNLVKQGDVVIAVQGWTSGLGHTNTIRILHMR
ncbi:hypothetical protein BZG36_02809 [Bifiguratus adelaidae]|uniref:pyruvate kinase n=1 Tax=Bifiguratus adelaidae TaxID=1938954 RepID=A0A261Y1H2_9FUNG|nr:hypothetical protein BZG36_02809 [Bifiguratus adelaidae]